MSRMRALVFATAGTLLLSLALAPLALYVYGLSHIPPHRFEILSSPVPSTASSALWQTIGGSGAPRLNRANPYSLGLALLMDARARHVSYSAEHRLAGLASRALLPRGEAIGGGMARWHLASAAAQIWVARNWSAPRAIEVLLGNAYYGNGLVGLEAASRGYFGIDAAALSAGQAAVLVVTQIGPSRLDPWCNQAANRERARILTQEPIPPPLPKPAEACS